MRERVGDGATDRTDGDPRTILRYLRRPDRYTRFLDEDDTVGGDPHGRDVAEEIDRAPGSGRELTGVAARLAAALNAESERSHEEAGPESAGPGPAAEPEPGSEPTGPTEPTEPTEPTAQDTITGTDGGGADETSSAAEPAGPAEQDGDPGQVSSPGPGPDPEKGSEPAVERAVEPVAEPVVEPPAPPAPHHRLRHPVLRAPVTTVRTRTSEPDAQRAAHYLAHAADLTLSGGLETALAAAPAVCTLAEQYALRRVGGSSASAVTAACAAAAELGRTAPPSVTGGDGSPGGAVPPGFAGLATAVAWLAGDLPEGTRGSRLTRMLRPDAATRPLFRLVEAGMRPRRPLRGGRTAALFVAASGTLDRASRVVVGLLWLGALAGATGVIVAMARSPHVAGAVVTIAGVPIAVTFTLAAAFGTAVVGWHAVRGAVRQGFEGDGFGLISGSADEQPTDDVDAGPDGVPASGADSEEGPPALFDWVADRLDDLAGVPPVTGGAQRYALTFGELWLGRMGGRAAADVRTLRRAAADPRRRVVDLLLVTADVSSGRPRLVPFGVTERPEQHHGDPGFAFCRTCLVGLLPARVVDQMVLMSRGSVIAVTGTNCPRHAGQPLHDLPEPWDLPVVFAVRLAAATPVLLRPVPLYSLGTGPADVRTHWFADGAATGGLPNHVFDAPLPRWPTFTLAACSATAPGSDVDVPDQDAAPHTVRWRPATGTAGLAAALFGAAGGWRDALHAEAPARRGRFATVRGTGVPLPRLGEKEIGLLAVRGYRAGRVLRERFRGPDVPLPEGFEPSAGGESGEGHTGTDRFRWIRMRAALTEYRQLSLAIGASIPLYTDLALTYRVPADLSDWFSPPLAAGHADPAWGDAVSAVTHLRSLTDGGVLDWDTDWGAPPSDPHERLT